MTPWSEIFGAELLGKDGVTKTEDALQNKKIVGIYFSSKSCLPCREFTPLLATVYEEMVEEHPEFEIVYVSSDKDDDEFTNYFHEMPWKALPFTCHDKRQELKDEYTTLIPWLAFLNEKGEFLTEDGRMIVSDALGDINQIWETALPCEAKEKDRAWLKGLGDAWRGDLWSAERHAQDRPLCLMRGAARVARSAGGFFASRREYRRWREEKIVFAKSADDLLDRHEERLRVGQPRRWTAEFEAPCRDWGVSDPARRRSTPVVNVSSMEVSAPSAFVIPEDDEDADLTPTYIPPFSVFDLDSDAKINVEEYLTHLIKLHDAALSRVEASSLSDVAKEFISDHLRRNYATEAWCVARLAAKVHLLNCMPNRDKTSTDGVSMDRFKLFYSMIKEFCMVVDPNIPAEFNLVDVPPSPVDRRSTDAPNDPSILVTASPPTKMPPSGLSEGQAIKCDLSEPEVYRFADGQRRHYPDPEIAASWDPFWDVQKIADCALIPSDPDMPMMLPSVADGQAVLCEPSSSVINRYWNGTVRLYPSPAVAESWDPTWNDPLVVDCSSLSTGPDMPLNLPPPTNLPERQAIKCDPNQPEVYRYRSGKRRWYPNPSIATSWDPIWFNFVTVDSSSLPRGKDMGYKQHYIAEGQAIKCDTGPYNFRYTNGTIRWYPDPPIASSWDPNWFNPIYVDCFALPRGFDLTLRASNNSWTQLDGSLVQLSFDGKQLCGVNANDDIWCASENIRGEGPTKWRRLPGKLIQITVYGDALYGVNRENKIYFGSAVTSDPNWREIPGWLKQITTDNKQICGVNALGGVFCADSNIRVDPNWRKLPGQFTQVELVNGRLFALRSDSAIFSGRAYGDPAWVKLDGLLRQMSYDGVRFCGTNTGDDVWCANSGLLGNPNWMLTPGKMRSAVVQAGDLFASDQSGNIFYRRTAE
ncbi:Nucleoredoxin, partial [Globisporangium splendens]